MGHFHLIDEGIDVSRAIAQLDACPHLWNVRTERRDSPGSPHTEMSDIWVRYRAVGEITGPESFRGPHKSVMWPAWRELTEFQEIVGRVVEKVNPKVLGGILITRIPSGGKIDRHNDAGSWHAEFYDRKFYVPLRANAGCVNECGGEVQVMREGECWEFNNLVDHSVTNAGQSERITAIICTRCDSPENYTGVS